MTSRITFRVARPGRIAAMLAALTTLAMTAQAGPLPPGTTTPTTGITAAAAPRLAGTVEQDLLEPFSFATGTGYVTGTVQHTIVRSVDGTVDFYWRIHVDPGSTGRVNRLTVYGFQADPSSLLLADYRPDDFGTVPSDWADRSAGTGTTIQFTLANGVGPGEYSHSLMLDSKEGQAVRKGKLVLQGVGGGASATQLTFVPAH